MILVSDGQIYSGYVANKPDTKTFAELVKLVQHHYASKPSTGVSVASYLAELFHLTDH